MDDTARITVDLSHDVVKAIDDAVAAGDFASRSEAVEAALWKQEGLDLYSPSAVARFKRLMAEGLASGVSEPWDSEAMFKRITDPARARKA